MASQSREAESNDVKAPVRSDGTGGVGAPLMLLITDFRGLIPQRIQSWDGDDLDMLSRTFKVAGMEVRILGASEVSLGDVRRRRTAAIYASSQHERYRQYLLDLMTNLYFAGVVLFPSLEGLMAHEDKVFQSIRLTRTDICAPRTFVFGDRSEVDRILSLVKFPLLGKEPEGWGSSGVRVLSDVRGAKQFADRCLVHRVLKKGRSRARRAFERVIKPEPAVGLGLFQELIPGLEGDWKILVWGELACGFFRQNRADDVRASGSGRFQFIELPVSVLEFAWSAMKALDLPWGSFDVGFDGHACWLLEYQAIHFGLIGAEKSTFHYRRSREAAWERVEGRIDVEAAKAAAVLSDLRDRGWFQRGTLSESGGAAVDGQRGAEAP